MGRAPLVWRPVHHSSSSITPDPPTIKLQPYSEHDNDKHLDRRVFSQTVLSLPADGWKRVYEKFLPHPEQAMTEARRKATSAAYRLENYCSALLRVVCAEDAAKFEPGD